MVYDSRTLCSQLPSAPQLSQSKLGFPSVLGIVWSRDMWCLTLKITTKESSRTLPVTSSFAMFAHAKRCSDHQILLLFLSPGDNTMLFMVLVFSMPLRSPLPLRTSFSAPHAKQALPSLRSSMRYLFRVHEWWVSSDFLNYVNTLDGMGQFPSPSATPSDSHDDVMGEVLFSLFGKLGT